MYERFTDRSRKVMQLANQEAQRFGHEYIGTEHILLALIKEGSGVAAHVLKNLSVDLRAVRREVEKIVQHGSGDRPIVMGKLPQTPRAKKTIEYSIEEARSLNHNYVGTEHLLLGLIREEEGVASIVLKNLGVMLEAVRQEILDLLGTWEPDNRPEFAPGIKPPTPHRTKASTPRLTTQPMPHPDQFSSPPHVIKRVSPGITRQPTPHLDQFTVDMADWPCGRSVEVERVLELLGRQQPRSILLVEQNRLTRQAVVGTLAHNLMASPLAPRRLVALDLERLAVVAGGAKTEREQAQAGLADALATSNLVLFLEPLLRVSDVEALKRLRGAIILGNIRVAAGASPKEWQTLLANDPALAARFEIVRLHPPTAAESVEWIRTLRDRYEAHHRVWLRDEAIQSAVTLTTKHVADGGPNAALDLIDDACSRARLSACMQPPEFAEIDAQIAALNQEKESKVAENDFEKAAAARDQLEKLKARRGQVAQEWRERVSASECVVDETVIRQVIAARTGLPFLRGDDATRTRLLRLSDEWNATVFGQPEAVAAVARVLSPRLAGVSESRPLARLLFAGSSGTGKTHFARELARTIYGDENALIRMDLSAYPTSPDRSRLTTDLILAARNRTAAVLILDHAHADDDGLLLPILEDGCLTDGTGSKIDFRNTIVVMTLANDTLTFRPTFLARLDAVVSFRLLTADALTAIVQRELAALSSRLTSRNLTLTISPEVSALVASRLPTDHGGHAIHQTLDRLIAVPLTEFWLRGDFAGATVRVGVTDGDEPQLQFVRTE